MDILQFIFQDFWYFAGSLLLIAVFHPINYEGSKNKHLISYIKNKEDGK
jgi:hypothetical protein